jgi:hypothetical protein
LKLADHLSKKQKRQLEEMSPKKEVLSQRDLDELMGKNRDTYKRVNGAVRRKG